MDDFTGTQKRPPELNPEGVKKLAEKNRSHYQRSKDSGISLATIYLLVWG